MPQEQMGHATLKRFPLSDIEVAMFEDGGFCILCGEPSDDAVEPDARGYRCGACGKPGVHGAEEILLMDLVD